MTVEGPDLRASLAFRDPALEREYLAELAHSTRRDFRLGTIAIPLLWASAAWIDLDNTAAGTRVMLTIRFAIVMPLVLGYAAFVHTARPERYARWLLVWSPLNLGALLFGLAAMCACVPDVRVFNLFHALIGISLTIAIGLVLLVPRFGPQLATAAAGALACGLAIGVRWPSMAVSVVYWFVAALLGGGLSGWYLDRYRRHAFWFGRALARERERSEQLLRNVLPEAVAERLKASPGRIADRYDEVTVLFADLVGFTPLSQRLSPEELVATLDRLFTAFDEAAERHGLEKIKTIGDAYMVVGGAPVLRPDHAIAVAEMALEMRAIVAATDLGLRVRIGLHCGPVVAGVIGVKKLTYDLWGETVNLASRMESHGIEDAIQISEAAQRRLADRFVLEPRGPVAIKGVGEVPTWILVGRR